MIEIYKNVQQEINILKERKVMLETELKTINNLKIKKEIHLESMKKHLKELTGIENKLYYQIVVLGNSITKSVDKVAFDADKDVSTIWKNYYPKVKERIKELETLAKDKYESAYLTLEVKDERKN